MTYRSEQERNQDLAARYAGKFFADQCTDTSDEGLRLVFEKCVMPPHSSLYPQIRKEIAKIVEAENVRAVLLNAVKEALGIDPDKGRVKCSHCGQWTPNADAVLGNKEEDGVWCPKCAGCLVGTGYFPDEIESFGLLADEIINGVSEEAVLQELYGPVERMRGAK